MKIYRRVPLVWDPPAAFLPDYVAYVRQSRPVPSQTGIISPVAESPS